ncbi:hypothetical protein PMIN01_04674 [Paraphaeosphaeria minitans]|uniref:Uncharacterized protein n=1 Tax=Paraphaeosphaeria minitans TaxID=565426 RepID=A0A9P6GM37_9PLEO|nr:hypothetical protein PMIN01_04674 [Paraphaeosphaeria minitans]
MPSQSTRMRVSARRHSRGALGSQGRRVPHRRGQNGIAALGLAHTAASVGWGPRRIGGMNAVWVAWLFADSTRDAFQCTLPPRPAPFGVRAPRAGIFRHVQAGYLRQGGVSLEVGTVPTRPGIYWMGGYARPCKVGATRAVRRWGGRREGVVGGARALLGGRSG